MELGSCSLESVAQSLRLEPRSLQRRLKAEGLSFSGLLDDWRRARALSLITHTRLPLSQVSEAVGYADQSVFTRAFQRWYGASPLAYRYRDAAQLAAL
jgi:AraC-like DNA-binding protein